MQDLRGGKKIWMFAWYQSSKVMTLGKLMCLITLHPFSLLQVTSPITVCCLLLSNRPMSIYRIMAVANNINQIDPEVQDWLTGHWLEVICGLKVTMGFMWDFSLYFLYFSFFSLSLSKCRAILHQGASVFTSGPYWLGSWIEFVLIWPGEKHIDKRRKDRTGPLQSPRPHAFTQSDPLIPLC